MQNRFLREIQAIQLGQRATVFVTPRAYSNNELEPEEENEYWYDKDYPPAMYHASGLPEPLPFQMVASQDQPICYVILPDPSRERWEWLTRLPQGVIVQMRVLITAFVASMEFDHKTQLHKSSKVPTVEPIDRIALDSSAHCHTNWSAYIQYNGDLFRYEVRNRYKLADSLPPDSAKISAPVVDNPRHSKDTI